MISIKNLKLGQTTQKTRKAAPVIDEDKRVLHNSSIPVERTLDEQHPNPATRDRANI